MNKPNKILIIRTDRIGDLILSTPVIKNLRFAFPSSHISFICRPYTKDIINNNPYLNEVIVYDKYGKHKSIISTLKFAFFLRKQKFDWVIILHPTNRANLISFFAGIALRIGWDRKCGFLLTHKLKHIKQEGLKHESEYNLDILRSLGVPIKDQSLDFILDEGSKPRVKKILEDNNIESQDILFVIHAWASCVSKRWPKKNFIKLIDLLQKEYNPKIVLVGSVKDSQIGDPIIKSHKNILDLRGQLSINELAVIIACSNLFISNDSGPVHIAAALGVGVISIFGRKDSGLSPKRWAPLGKRSMFLHKDAGCNECFAHNCSKNFLCLESIKPEDVFAGVKMLLTKDRKLL